MPKRPYPRYQRQHDAILFAVLENPMQTNKEIAKATGYSPSQVSRITCSQDFVDNTVSPSGKPPPRPAPNIRIASRPPTTPPLFRDNLRFAALQCASLTSDAPPRAHRSAKFPEMAHRNALVVGA